MENLLHDDTTSDIEAQLEAALELEKQIELGVREAERSIAEEQYKELRNRKNRRQAKENQWLTSEALYLGPLAFNDARFAHTPFVKEAKKRRPDFNIVGTKCEIAISTIETTQFGAGDKNWSIRESAAPEGQGDIKTAAKLMEAEIHDQLQRAEYGRNARRAIRDYVIRGTGIMKAPLTLSKPKKSWQQDPSGAFIPVISQEFTPGARHVDPWMFYPAADCTRVEDMDDTIEVHLMTPRQLKELQYSSAFKQDAITALLEEGLRPQESNDEYPESADLTGNSDAWRNRYVVLEGYRKIKLSELERLYGKEPAGIEQYSASEDGCVFCEIWTCRDRILRIQPPLLETCQKPPYCVAVWKEDPSSLFGFSAPITMADQQRVVTNAWRMLLDNAEVSSGPQVAINKDRIEAADGDTSEIRGWKVWNVTDFDTKVQDAISFFMPPNIQEGLMNTLNAARSFADEESGIPLMQGGFEGPSAEQSATGTAIQAQRSTAALFSKSTAWDDYITRPLIEDLYEWNMIYNPRPEIKGDYEIDVSSTTSALKQQMELSNLEKLSVEVAQNSTAQEWINPEELYRTRMQMMRISNPAIVNTAEQVEQARQQKQSQPDPAMMKLEIEKMLADVKAREVAIEEARLQYEMQQGQQREYWEHIERMATAAARDRENMSDMYVAAAKRDERMMELASKEGIKLAEIEARLHADTRADEFKRFEAGMKARAKAAEIANTQTELELKAKHGTGI